ncbi:unnamed protein product [Effrenium voratum]|nr:unnamed protein product [Effrenium voratum]
MSLGLELETEQAEVQRLTAELRVWRDAQGAGWSPRESEDTATRRAEEAAQWEAERRELDTSLTEQRLKVSQLKSAAAEDGQNAKELAQEVQRLALRAQSTQRLARQRQKEVETAGRKRQEEAARQSKAAEELQLTQKRLEVERELKAAQQAQLHGLRDTISAVRQQLLHATRENTELRAALASNQEILRQLRQWINFRMPGASKLLGSLALVVSSANDCDGILAGPECCAPEEVGETDWNPLLQDNMVKFGKVIGEGSHRFESSLNPALCDRDLEHFTDMVSLASASAPSSQALGAAFEACRSRRGRLLQMDLHLRAGGACDLDLAGWFCSPVSCAAPYEKWILSARHFLRLFPHCAKFAVQPCVWQNAAKMYRLVHVRDLALVFQHMELSNLPLQEHTSQVVDPSELLTALHSDSDLLPWPLVRPFADLAQTRRPTLRLSAAPPEKLRLPALVDLSAPWALDLLCQAANASHCAVRHLRGLERLLGHGARLRWQDFTPLCREELLKAAPQLEAQYAAETAELVRVLARAGHAVPPELVLSLAELCESRRARADDWKGRRSCVTAEAPTGCSCRNQPAPCFPRTAPCAVSFSGAQRRAVVAAFDLQIPLEQPYRTWGLHAAPLDFLLNFDLRRTTGPRPDRVLLLPPEKLAKHPLRERTRKRLQRAQIRVIEVPWIEPPDISASVARRNRENHFGNREYIRLHAMNLDEYDVIVYLDTDVRIVGDLAPAFNCGQQMFLATGSLIAPLDGGFFAVKPSRALFSAMLEVLQKIRYDRETGWNRMNRSAGYRKHGVWQAIRKYLRSAGRTEAGQIRNGFHWFSDIAEPLSDSFQPFSEGGHTYKLRHVSQFPA